MFRGPNTVSYGANALMGVINIITRAPGESPRHAPEVHGGPARHPRLVRQPEHRPGRQRLPPVAVRPGRRRFDRDHDGHALRDAAGSAASTSTPATAWRRTRAWSGNWRPRKARTSTPTPTARRFPRFPTTSTTPIRSPTTMPVLCAGMSTSTRATASIYKATHSTGSAGRNGTPARRPLPSARNWRSSGN